MYDLGGDDRRLLHYLSFQSVCFSSSIPFWLNLISDPHVSPTFGRGRKWASDENETCLRPSIHTRNREERIASAIPAPSQLSSADDGIEIQFHERPLLCTLSSILHVFLLSS
ncbi:unnamed protein product [Lactuca saligna]|uniref:Uncharacterized protein n=1 Tax=Lactuca saligna TaxID=75948 RepID=A0AA36ELU3_LACSI|nr:unnamed protein product [Lactuca saligna]